MTFMSIIIIGSSSSSRRSAYELHEVITPGTHFAFVRVLRALTAPAAASPAGLAREARVLIGRIPATSAPGLGALLPHLRRYWAHPRHICAGTAPGLGAPLPHLHRDWARPCHICAGTGRAPATSAPRLGSPLLQLTGWLKKLEYYIAWAKDRCDERCPACVL
jgi:hypothetical protein